MERCRPLAAPRPHEGGLRPLADLIDIADAVVTELNAESWSEEFTASRKNVLDLEHEDLSTLTVVVVPVSYAKSNRTRGSVLRDCIVAIGIIQQLEQLTEAAANTTTDPLFDLVEEIDDHFDALQLPGLATASWQGSETPMDQDALQERNTFLAAIHLTYRVSVTR